MFSPVESLESSLSVLESGEEQEARQYRDKDYSQDRQNTTKDSFNGRF